MLEEGIRGWSDGATSASTSGLLRPSLVLARNPNRRGTKWPARLCDKEEAEERLAEQDLPDGGKVTWRHDFCFSLCRVLLQKYIFLSHRCSRYGYAGLATVEWIFGTSVVIFTATYAGQVAARGDPLRLIPERFGLLC